MNISKGDREAVNNRQRAARLARRPLEPFLRRVKNELGLEEASLTVCLVSVSRHTEVMFRLRRINTIVVPPPQMVANMKVGSMDTFCVCEPWNLQLIHQKIGYTALTTSELWVNHPEKAFAMRAASNNVGNGRRMSEPRAPHGQRTSCSIDRTSTERGFRCA